MTQCSCGKPEVCDYHEYQSWQVTFGNGWPFGIKDDYRETECDAGTCDKEGCTGLAMGVYNNPAVFEFEPGASVRIGMYGASGIMDHSHPSESRIYPHFNRYGTVVKKVEERMYAVQFDNGETLCFYHNELRPAVPERFTIKPVTTPTWLGPWVVT